MSQENSTPQRTGKPNYSAKSHFVGDNLSNLIHRICHEIDNPLTAIISLATVIDRSSDFHTEDKERESSYPSSIVREAWRVSKLIEKLRMLITTRSGDPSECDANETLFNVLAKIRDDEQFASITADVKAPSPALKLEIDPPQLYVLLHELVLNAHEACLGEAEANRKIAINVDTEKETTTFTISTRSAKPCPENDLNKLFRPFCKGDPNSRQLGLGLSVAWAITERFQGSISVEEHSRDGGYEFTTRVLLPNSAHQTRTVQAKTNQPTPVETQHLEQKNLAILIIEDEHSVATAIEKILQVSIGREHDLTIVRTDGSEAEELLRAGTNFQAILCDLNLKETSGSEIFSTVQTERPDLICRFAFLTGDRRGGEAEQFLQSSKRPYLLKPFEAETLIALVTGLVANDEST